MSNENPTHDDWKDRLIDHALREVVGSETPPDLSEKILSAATGEQAAPTTTLAPGADEMATQHTSPTTRRGLWITMTVAASLLVGSTLLLPTFFPARRESARTPTFQSPSAAEVAQRDRKLNLNANDKISLAEESDDLDAASIVAGSFRPRNSNERYKSTTGQQKKKDSGIELPRFESTPVTSTVEVADGGTVVSGGIKRLEQSRSQSKDELMMAVTPRIIIEEQEEERLGIAVEDFVGAPVERPGHSAQGGKRAVDAPTSGMGQQGLINDANGVLPQQELAPVVSNEEPALPSPYYLTDDVQYYAPGPEFKLAKEAARQAAEQKKIAGDPLPDFSVDLDQPFRNNSFGLTTPEFGSSPQSADQGQPAAPTAKRESQGMQSGKTNRPEGGQRFRIDSSPGSVVNRYLVELGDQVPKPAPVSGDDKLVEQSLTRLHVVPELVVPVDRKGVNNRLSLPQQRTTEESLRRKQLGDIALRLSKKVANYRTLSTRIDRDFNAIAGMVSADPRYDKLEKEIQQLQQQLGRGADASGDKYARIHENPFVKAVGEKAVSTFSIDVDTASYANVRQFISQSGQLPPPDAVRIEELVNYFDYDYTPPTDDTPFASHVEVAGCPWKAGHRLVRVGIKGRELQTENRPQSNLVFLIDVSGSMNEPSKLPLLVEGMKMLTRELGENDRIAIVVYASSEGLALPSIRGDQQDTILSALQNLRAGGSTAGGAGIELAYEIAEKNFIQGGVNRIILATDGDFNVGVTSPGALEEMAESNAKETGVFLTVLGFGRGNLNDDMMEKISGKGNGNYHYIDNTTEARKVLVAEMAGTLVTIAKDVKIQVEFNPAQVAAYRLVGYENRMLRTEDFNDDTKDAGEIGAGHTVTAVYEVVPAGMTVDTPGVDPLKYQQPAEVGSSSDLETNDADASDELLTLKIRYKQPDEDTSTKLEFPITDEGQSFAKATDDFKFASAVASFGMLLRHSQHQGITSYSAVEEIAQDGTGDDQHGYRAEFLQLVRQARQLAGE